MMRPLSAVEAIRPSIQRTRTILFHPFRAGRSAKLAAVGYLSTFGLFFIPIPLFFLFARLSQPGPRPVASLSFSAVYSIVLFILFCIGTRMDFVLLDIVLFNEKSIAPSWRRHGYNSLRWTAFKLLFSVAIAAVYGPVIYAVSLKLLPQLGVLSRQKATSLNYVMILYVCALQILTITPVILLSSLLTNFVLPLIALENATVRQGIRRFFSLITADTGAVSIFILFKVLLGFASYVALDVAITVFILVALVVAAVIGILAVLLFHFVADASQVSQIVFDIYAPVSFAFFFYGLSLFWGSLCVFFQAHALYFLGGRYPRLGAIIEPPPQVEHHPAPVGPLLGV